MVTAEELSTSGIRVKLRAVQRGCEDRGEFVPTTAVCAVEMACEGIEMKCKNATMSSLQTDIETKLVEIRAARRTMCSQTRATESLIKPLKTHLSDTQLALAKLANESAKSKDDL